MERQLRTQVGIVGAGPAGLFLSHLLHRAGIDSIVVDDRSREDDRVDDPRRHPRAGHRRGAHARPAHPTACWSTATATTASSCGSPGAAEGHRIDFADLVGRGVWLYPQHEVLKDLIARRLADGGDLRFGWTAAAVQDAETATPRIIGTDDDGEPFEIVADFVIGADGSRSVAREAVTGSQTGGYFREYPFAWFGILCEAPPSAPELIYSASEQGFALISQRSATVQRMYLQCDPDLDPASMSDAEIWDGLQQRVGGGADRGADLPARRAAVPQLRRPRAAEGQRRSDGRRRAHRAADRREGDEPGDRRRAAAQPRARRRSSPTARARCIDGYAATALDRIWRAQHFSWWMTSMLHAGPADTEFDRLRRFGELGSVRRARAPGSTYLAEAYTGWPLDAGW